MGTRGVAAAAERTFRCGVRLPTAPTGFPLEELADPDSFPSCCLIVAPAHSPPCSAANLCSARFRSTSSRTTRQDPNTLRRSAAHETPSSSTAAGRSGTGNNFLLRRGVAACAHPRAQRSLSTCEAPL